MRKNSQQTQAVKGGGNARNRVHPAIDNQNKGVEIEKENVSLDQLGNIAESTDETR